MKKLFNKKFTDKLPHFWREEKTLSRPVLENILVGTLMGTLVAIFLKAYLKQLESLNLDWTLLFIILVYPRIEPSIIKDAEMKPIWVL